MKIGFSFVNTEEVSKKLDICLEKEKLLRQKSFDIESLKDFEELNIGIICVLPQGEKFHGVLPVVSKKNRMISFGIRLNHEIVKNLPKGERVWEYTIEQIEKQINVLDDIRNKSIDKEFLKKKIVEAVKSI